MYQLISSFRLKTKVPLVSWLLSEFFPQKCSAQQFFASGQGRAGKGQTFTDQAFSVQGETTVNKWINARVSIFCFTNVYAQKWPNLVQNKHFGHFGPNIGLSGPFDAMPDQKSNANGVPLPRWFSDMWVPKISHSPQNMRILTPKQLNLARKSFV